MFNFSWSEIALIAIVALVAIGPKDLPAGLKTLAQLLRKVRGMAGQFQGQMDELLRDAELGEIRDQINEIRHFDLKGTVERTIDPDHSIEKTLNEDPFTSAENATPATGSAGSQAEPLDGASSERWDGPDPEDAGLGTPAFIPPSVALAALRPPAFVPPELLATHA